MTKALTTLFLLAAITFSAHSQVAISNLSEVAKIKNGTTYVAMRDTTTPRVKDYMNAIRNSWTISKVEFIKYTDIEKYIAPGNAFLTVSGYETSTQFITLYHGRQLEGMKYTNTHIYLELWTCSDKYFESKKPRAFLNTDKVQVARIELYTDFETLSDPSNIFQNDYSGMGHIRNWGPGILKNYIQSLMVYLNGSETRKLYEETVNEVEIKKLKTETLYVPDYVMIKFNKFNGDESKTHDEEDLFEDYKLKYKVISTDQLNKKILTDTTPFYYLVYVKSSTDKFVSVINSQTGEMIYSAYSPASYNFKSGDLKDIQKKTE